MAIDSQSGYVEPTGANKYLDAEETARQFNTKPVVRQRVSDPAVQAVLDTISTELTTGILSTQEQNPLNLSALATIAAQNAQTAILTSIRDNTDGLELSLTDIDLNTDEIEASLTNIFTELAEKLEAGDVTGLATAANQLSEKVIFEAIRDSLDTVEAKLQSLIDKDYATSTKQDTHITRATEIRDTVAKDVTVGNRFAGGKLQRAVQITNSGDNIIVTPTIGLKVRVHWLGLSTSETNSSETLAIVKFGSIAHYRWNMGVPGAFSHWEIIEGEIGEDFVINLSASQPVEVNYTYQLL